MRSPPERPWQYELLDKMPSSIDLSLLEETLRMSPAERIAQVQALNEAIEQIWSARDNRLR